MSVLVVGGRGSVGSQVVSGLTRARVEVRASSRSGDRGEFPAGVDVVRADLTDPSTFGSALQGIDGVFLYAEAEQIDSFCRAAQRAGVQHVVLLSSNSVLFPDAEQNPTARKHMAVEAALRRSGLAWTFVRPGYLATNTYRWRDSIRAERTVRTAFPDGDTPLVHERDVAAVAVQALLDDRHRGQSYLVLGGEARSERQQVETIAAALGEPIALDVLSVEAYRKELSRSVPSVFVEPILASAGRVPQVPVDVRIDCVPAVLGRAPLTFARWAADHVEDFR